MAGTLSRNRGCEGELLPTMRRPSFPHFPSDPGRPAGRFSSGCKGRRLLEEDAMTRRLVIRVLALLGVTLLTAGIAAGQGGTGTAMLWIDSPIGGATIL